MLFTQINWYVFEFQAKRKNFNSTEYKESHICKIIPGIYDFNREWVIYLLYTINIYQWNKKNKYTEHVINIFFY